MKKTTIREINNTQCKCYLVSCPDTFRALLVDPHLDFFDRYLALLAYEKISLTAVVDTHTHADHRSAAHLFRNLLGVPAIQHMKAPNPEIDRHVENGDTITCGEIELSVLHTPGHTPDSISLYTPGYIFTGDVLLIGGTGRADFAGGDSGEQYDAITRKLFTLPDDTVILPGHDYRGNTESTISEEKRTNPRVAGKSRQEYIALMAAIDFPLPKKIQEVLQPNQSAIDDDSIKFPDLATLNAVRQLSAPAVFPTLGTASEPRILDVREPSEFAGELGHIPNSTLIPLKDLQHEIHKLSIDRHEPIVVVCRSGVRSTTGAAILTGMGYTQVANLKGGMLDWREAGFKVER